MIVLICEGETETALKGKLKEFIDGRALQMGRPKPRFRTKEWMTLGDEQIKRRLAHELSDQEVIGVVGLVDVYPKFHSVEEARTHLLHLADNHPRFYAHAAKHDVEAWLLPYWDSICRRVGVRQSSPGGSPEDVNHTNPPAYRLSALYRRAKPKPRKYVKPIEMAAILRDKDLVVSANRCPEFKSLLNTLLSLSNLPVL